MFSERTRWDLRPNRLADRLAAKRAAGARVLDLTLSNPTQAGLSCPADVLAPLAGRNFSIPASVSIYTSRGRPTPCLSSSELTSPST